MTDKSSTVRQHYRPVITVKRPKIRNRPNSKFSQQSKRRFNLPPKQEDTEKDES